MAGETTNTPASATTAVQDDSGNVRDEERRVNYAAREHDGGKATSPERDALYQHPETRANPVRRAT